MRRGPPRDPRSGAAWAVATGTATCGQKYLIDKGVAAERLFAKGYGPVRPIAANTTSKGRAQNRRVDFIFLDPPTPPLTK